MGGVHVVRVLLADADPAVRARLRAALEADGCVVCAEAGSADEAVGGALAHRPAVALLDLALPGRGVAAAREIARRLPGTAIVMLSAEADEENLLDALRAGASGYLRTDTDATRLGSIVRDVLDGEAAIPRRLVRRLTEEFRAPAMPRYSRTSRAASLLSTREWEVMELLGGGLTTDQVARRLFVSSTTVRVHVSAAVRKLRVADRESAFALLRETS